MHTCLSVTSLSAPLPKLAHSHRRDELRAAWAAFTPLLHAIDRGEVTPLPYPAGSRGPPASDVLVSRAGFVKNKARLPFPPRHVVISILCFL